MRSKPILPLLALLLTVPLFAADKTALLIANSDYGEHPLPEATANVEKLAKVLEQAGFTVTVKENIEKGSHFRKELETYATTCPNGGVSLLYFCGYGSGFDRKMARTIEKPNGTKEKEWYTEPDSGIWGIADNTPYRIEDLIQEFRMRSHARLNLLVLDCAYKYPKAKENQQGLMAIDPKTWPGGMVCFAAPPGKTLPAGTPSALVESLSRNLLVKERPLGEAMEAVRAEVATKSGGKQEIWTGFSLPKDASAYLTSSRKRKIATTKLPPGNPKPGDEWINSLGMVFCWCPPGSFRMGLADASTPATRDAKQVDVAISGGFWISKYEVTVGDYSRARHGRDKPLRGPLGFVPFNVSNVPLTNTSPDGALGFSKYLNTADGKAGHLPKDWSYRLPTEAEWEYACRAGSTSRFSFGDSARELHRYANFADAELLRQNSDFYYADPGSNDDTGERPASIGSYEPNAWGIHDMHGNVIEICADRYLPELPGGTDPWVTEVEKGQPNIYVMRGGGWSSTAQYCRAGFRNSVGIKSNSAEFANVGFRVVLTNKHVSGNKK